MNKKNRCPYCGKRITYSEKFSYRRKAEYVCPRCGKESRVFINKKVILVFIICAILAAAIMTAWIVLDLTSNPLGILAVAFPLIIFGLVSPNFVRFEPLKKYQKSMEAKRAGIEYSDNLSISELDEEVGYVEGSNQFQINNDVFNKIKAERNATVVQAEDSDLVSDSAELENNIDSNIGSGEKMPYVEVTEDVRENHSAADDSPLKKIHSEGTRINRSRHYIEEPVSAEEEIFGSSENTEPKMSEKPDNNRFSANRRF